MANRHRGDVDLQLSDGVIPLRLTLGALADIETAFGADGLIALGKRLESGGIGTRDLVALLGAAARGAGARIDDADLASRIGAGDIPACVEALGQLFVLTFGKST